jgi:methionyl-tRNA synthetase
MNIARIGNKYLTETEPWKIAQTDIERTKAIIAVCLEIVGRWQCWDSRFCPLHQRN